MNKRDTNAMRKRLRRRGEVNAEAKARGYHAIHRFIARGIK